MVVAKLLIDGVAIDSAEVNWHLGVGIGVNRVVRLSVDRPDLCIRLGWGRLMAGYWGEPPTVSTGTMDCELTIADWDTFATHVAQIPQREGYPPPPNEW